MRLCRRQFVQSIAALAAGGLVSSKVHSVSLALEIKEWTRCWPLWNTLSLEVSSVAFGPQLLDLRGLQELEARFGHFLGPCVTDSSPSLGVTFLWHEGDQPLMNARLPSHKAILMLPGAVTWAAHRWRQVGLCYEEWALRALVGSFLHKFPCSLDFADLRSWLFFREDNEEGLLSAAALQLGPQVGTAAVDAFFDAERMLRLQGHEAAFVYATYHGPLRASALLETREALSPYVDYLLIGNDWDESCQEAFVSVIVSGPRAAR